MKTKPDTKQFKKDPSGFLDGGAADVADAYGSPKKADKKVYRDQKMFRLSLDLIAELRREAYERTAKEGTRVTETEIVEQVLRNYFKI